MQSFLRFHPGMDSTSPGTELGSILDGLRLEICSEVSPWIRSESRCSPTKQGQLESVSLMP